MGGVCNFTNNEPACGYGFVHAGREEKLTIYLVWPKLSVY